MDAPSPFVKLMELVNKLQAACATAGDNSVDGKAGGMPGLWDSLPQIVAVGGQVCDCLLSSPTF